MKQVDKVNKCSVAPPPAPPAAGLPNKVLCGKALPRGPTPFIYVFDSEGTFSYTFYWKNDTINILI